jgi:transposase InsO family protein
MLALGKEGAGMPWQERSVMSERQEFVIFASQEGANITALCARFGISRKTGYKWLTRAAAAQPLADRSRRPCASPTQTPPAMEARILALRAEHPAWGGRKLHHRLRALGVADVPAPSTITAILRRHGLLRPDPEPRDFVRFEHPAPNEVWQMDFMGHRALTTGRVHPWTLLDDHSRFALGLSACADERQDLVKAHLTAVFRRYGLPRAILSDNGSPWASAGRGGLTALEAWLLRYGVDPWHGRPRHPQTQGKVERFHGAIAAEVFAHRHLADLGEAQVHFDTFRTAYNLERPHEALGYAVPVSRYAPSPRAFPETVPPVVYGPDEVVRTVSVHGSISWRGRRHFVSRGLAGEPVALRPTLEEPVWEIVYCHRHVATIDLTDPDEV